MKRLITRGLQNYWRFSRGLTLGAQACVLKADNSVLLIRHTYRPGWHFPGGGVERGESAEQALIRELAEETGIEVNQRAELFGLYSHREFYGDHIALYVVRHWSQPFVPPPNREIAEQGFFASDRLPGDIHPPVRVRISEILEGRAGAETW